MEGSFWQEANAWWRSLAERLNGQQEVDGNELLRRVWALTWTVAEAASLRHEDREDVVQDMLLKLQNAEAAVRLFEVDAPAHYVGGMIKNAVLNILQRRKTAQKVIRKHLESKPRRDDDRPASERAADLEEQTRVRFHVNHSVSAEDRVLLWGFYRDGLGLDELASRLKISPVAAAKRLSRARRRLRKLFED